MRIPVQGTWFDSLVDGLHRVEDTLKASSELRLAGAAHEPRRYQMREREVIAVKPEREALTVAVESGRVWLTGDSGEGDIVLLAGETHQVAAKRCRLVVEALADATLTLS